VHPVDPADDDRELDDTDALDDLDDVLDTDLDGNPGLDGEALADIDPDSDDLDLDLDDLDLDLDLDLDDSDDSDDSDDDSDDDGPVATIPAISDPIGTARRRHGAAGAVLAAGMFGVDIALGRKPKEDAPIVVASSSEPVDIESDGITIPVDEATSVYAPPQPKHDPLPPRRVRPTRPKR